jgi:hypothetical protein
VTSEESIAIAAALGFLALSACAQAESEASTPLWHRLSEPRTWSETARAEALTADRGDPKLV